MAGLDAFAQEFWAQVTSSGPPKSQERSVLVIHTKKSRERIILDLFRQAYPEFPDGDIEEFEHPDFLIHSATGTIGIELVDYVSGHSRAGSAERMQEELRDRIVGQAQTAFESDHDEIVWVTFFWYPGVQFTKSSPRQLGPVIAEWVARALPQTIPGKSSIERDDLEGSVLEYKLVCADIRREASLERSYWTNAEAGFLGSQPEELQAVITSKDSKFSEYRRACDEVWLLVVADGRHISSTFSPEEETLAHAYHSPFDRVFFFDLPTGIARRLKLVPQAAAL